MWNIWIICKNTIRQSIRQRLFLNIAVFGVGLVLLAMVVANITFGDSSRVVRSVGLSGVALAVDIMAILLAVGLVHGEIDRKTLFVVLARPVPRWQYLCGRYLGMMVTLALVLMGFSLLFFAAIYTTPRGQLSVVDLFALGAILPEAAIIGGVGIVLSTFSTPMISTGIGLAFWAAAASTDDLIGLTQKVEGPVRLVMKALYYGLPSLARLNFRDQAVYLQPVAVTEYLLSCGYGFLYASFLVALACVLLSRREMI